MKCKCGGEMVRRLDMMGEEYLECDKCGEKVYPEFQMW